MFTIGKKTPLDSAELADLHTALNYLDYHTAEQQAINHIEEKK